MIHDVKPPLRTFLFVSSMLCFHAFFIVEDTSIPGSCSYMDWEGEKKKKKQEGWVEAWEFRWSRFMKLQGMWLQWSSRVENCTEETWSNKKTAGIANSKTSPSLLRMERFLNLGMSLSTVAKSGSWSFQICRRMLQCSSVLMLELRARAQFLELALVMLLRCE